MVNKMNVFFSKIKFLFSETLMVSILSIPFTINILFTGGSPLIVFLPFVLLILDFKINPTKYFVFFVLFFLFYNNLIYYDTHLKVHELRLRYFSSLFLIISFLINLICLKKKLYSKYVNGFFLFLSLSFFVTESYSSFLTFDRSVFLKSLDFKYVGDGFDVKKTDQPVILIVLDELSSDKEIYNHTLDSLDLRLSLHLKERGFDVLSNVKTKSKRTTISMPSIFNFNLHSALKNDSIENIDKGLQTIDGFKEIFAESLLVDSLLKKSVKPYSYGIGKFKNGINDDDFYYHWEDKLNGTVFENVLERTIIGTLKDGLNRETKNIDLFRKKSLDKLQGLVPERNSFYYFHLFFPHDPFSYYDEYENVSLNYLSISEERYLLEHIKFKRWFVDKFIQIMDNNNFNNSRIIITGDHGFRYNQSINPELTDVYLKGYEINDRIDLLVVQDIGYIINKSF